MAGHGAVRARIGRARDDAVRRAHERARVAHEVGDHGLHFDVGSAERVRGVVAKVVVTLTDGRNVTSEVKL